MKLLLGCVIVVYIIPYCLLDLCQYNFTLSDLKGGLWNHVKSFMAGTFSIVINSCPNLPIDVKNINLLLFTRKNKSAIRIDLESPRISNKKTIILFAGWLCNSTNGLMPELKNAYLQRYDANVVVADWSKYSLFEYTTSYCYCPKIAKIIGSFLCKIMYLFNINPENIHLVGHSMGAHISGLIGQETRNQCGKIIGRITGLDPAGPLYQTVSQSKRLDKTDAKFVDVIHTNAGLLGYFGKCGTVDFYPNCGVQQTGCSLKNSSDFFKKAMSELTCDHLRSTDFMIESINSNRFKSWTCPHCPLLCKSENTSWSIMGENSIFSYKKDASYVLITNPTHPFGKG
ncbi:hypothetical protein FQR65_LT08178 [Abscondita terminalis]|nr:hypothetical protein FQR65_LT08178 [Abscondita terminalis]